MDGGEHPVRRVPDGEPLGPLLQAPPSLAHPERGAVDGLPRGGAEEHDALGLEHRELPDQPWTASGDVHAARALVDPPLATGAAPAEVLDHVGPVDLVGWHARLVESAV